MKFMHNLIVSAALLGMAAPIYAQDAGEPKAPTMFELKGVVFGEKITNCALVDGSIWKEGTSRSYVKAGKPVTAKLVKVERGKATFEIKGKDGQPAKLVVMLKKWR